MGVVEPAAQTTRTSCCVCSRPICLPRPFVPIHHHICMANSSTNTDDDDDNNRDIERYFFFIGNLNSPTAQEVSLASTQLSNQVERTSPLWSSRLCNPETGGAIFSFKRKSRRRRLCLLRCRCRRRRRHRRHQRRPPSRVAAQASSGACQSRT